MENDDLNMEDLEKGAFLPGENYSPVLADCEKGSLFQTTLLLREHLGETFEQRKSFLDKLKYAAGVTPTYWKSVLAIGKQLQETAINDVYGKISANWDEHFANNLRHNLAQVRGLSTNLGLSITYLMNWRVNDLKCATQNYTPNQRGGIELNEKLLRGTVEKATADLELLLSLPLKSGGIIDEPEVYRLAITKSLDKYELRRKELKPVLQNYNRKSDVMREVARMGLNGELPRLEIRNYLSRIQAMDFN